MRKHANVLAWTRNSKITKILLKKGTVICVCPHFAHRCPLCPPLKKEPAASHRHSDGPEKMPGRKIGRTNTQLGTMALFADASPSPKSLPKEKEKKARRKISEMLGSDPRLG